MLEVGNCPSWTGGVARSAGVVVQEKFPRTTTPSAPLAQPTPAIIDHENIPI
jgi:hypothetical protein